MNFLNYHHLQYFWTAVREGGITKASAVLHLTQPTLSKQIRLLEEQLGEALFDRSGRRLVLTDAGRIVYQYADEIFSLGQELQQNLKGIGVTRPRKLRVGASDLLPKLVAHRILAPVMEDETNTHLVCEEDSTERLLAELTLQNLDLILADAPVSAAVKIKAFNHLLGECGVTFFATPSLAKTLKGPFPANLNGARFLSPTDNTIIRRSLDHWFSEKRIRPRIVAEFHDSALMKVFGREGAGVFAGPSVIDREICMEYGVKPLGTTAEIRESFYAITVERKVKHPTVAIITENARRNLFKES